MMAPRRFVVLLLLLLLLLPASAAAESNWMAERAGPLIAASQAEIRAVHLGRHMSRTRWNELLDEILYELAPKGTWSPEHPAWSPARQALAQALREASLEQRKGELGGWIRRVLEERYSSLDPEETAKAVAFYESPGGKVFRDYRVLVLAEASYGLPYVIETESQETIRRRRDEAKERLLNLPEAQTAAVYDFNHSKTGDFLLGVENNIVADVVGNIMRSEMGALWHTQGEDLARRVRAAVPTLPAASAKAYLGTVTMRPDRTLDVVIEYREGQRMAGTYPLSYAPADPHWHDVASGVPGLKPGETRFLYRDPRGRLSDAP